MQTEFELMHKFIMRYGWAGLFDIVQKAPYNTNMFKLSTGEYIQYFHKTETGSFNWMYSLYAKWFPFTTKNEYLTKDLVPMEYIKKFSDAWLTIYFFGDEVDVARVAYKSMPKTDKYYSKLKDAIELYDKFDKYVINQYY